MNLPPTSTISFQLLWIIIQAIWQLIYSGLHYIFLAVLVTDDEMTLKLSCMFNTIGRNIVGVSNFKTKNKDCNGKYTH